MYHALSLLTIFNFIFQQFIIYISCKITKIVVFIDFIIFNNFLDIKDSIIFWSDNFISVVNGFVLTKLNVRRLLVLPAIIEVEGNVVWIEVMVDFVDIGLGIDNCPWFDIYISWRN